MIYFLLFLLIAIISVYIYALTRPNNKRDDLYYEKENEHEQDKLPFIYY
jgi:preprotein translocase subunit YajC